MTESSNDCFEKQEREQHCSNSNGSKTAVATSPEPSATEAANDTLTSIGSPSVNPVTPAEYIYNTMIPPSRSPMEETEELATLGKRERCNTGGSSKASSAAQNGPILSMDLYLSPEDLQADIDDMGGMISLNSEDAGLRSLKSADIVQSMLLPDVAATAAGALRGAEQPPPPSGDDHAKSPPGGQRREAERDEEDDFCPIVNLTAQLERISTADEIAPLNENFRISSKDWVRDFDESCDPGPVHPSLFQGNNAIRNPSPAPLSAPSYATNYSEYSIPLAGTTTGDWERVAEQFSTAIPLQNPFPTNTNCRELPSQIAPMSPLSNPDVAHSLPKTTSPTASATKGGTSPSSSTTSKRRKKKKKRTIDESVAVEPADDDVLFGRGGFTNTHPGNIKFRAKALELRPWYEQPTTSKEEKYQISDMLVESVRAHGHRFLERGEDGLWHEVIGNGARKKASQALRERIRGKRSSAGGSGSGGKLSSSVTSSGGKDYAKDLNVKGDVEGV